MPEELYLAKHLPYYNNMPLFNNYTTVTAAEHTLQLSFAGTLTLASITILGSSYSLNLCIIMLFPTQYLKVFISLVFPMMQFWLGEFFLSYGTLKQLTLKAEYSL